MKSFYRLLAAMMSAVMLAGILPSAVLADEEYPQGEVLHTYYEDGFVDGKTWVNAIGNDYISQVQDKTPTYPAKVGNGSWRIKVSTPEGYQSDGSMLYVNIATPVGAYTPSEDDYLAFWYQPLFKRSKLEAGLACDGGDGKYAMLRVDLSNYMTIDESEYNDTSVWKLVKIPMSDLMGDSAAFYANGTGLSEFNWDRLAGFSFAASDEGLTPTQMHLCRLDEVKIIRSENGGSEPSTNPTTVPSTEPTTDPGDTEYPQGDALYTYYEDKFVSGETWINAIGNEYISQAEDTAPAYPVKEGSKSWRIKLSVPESYQASGNMLYVNIATPPGAYTPSEDDYLAFWYQPLLKRDKLEAGLACDGGDGKYAMLRVDLSDYITIEDAEYNDPNVWKLVKIPVSDLKGSSAKFYANGTGLSEFNWDRLAGFSFAASDEDLTTTQMHLCRMDEIKLVRSGNGGSEPSTAPTTTPSTAPTADPGDTEYPQGDALYTYYEDSFISGQTWINAIGNEYISQVEDSNPVKEGTKSWRIKLSVPEGYQAGGNMLYVNIATPVRAYTPSEDDYLAFWYQPLLKRDKLEAGLACDGGDGKYAMLRVDLSNYITIEDAEYNDPNVWKLVKIPVSDLKGSSAKFYANGTGLSEFNWDRLAGFSFAASDEDLTTTQMHLCRMDEIKLVRSGNGGSEPSTAPTTTPSAVPTADPGGQEYPQGDVVYTIFDDVRNGWGNATPNWVSMIDAPDTSDKKEGAASQRIKIGGDGYVNTGDMLYASIVNNSIPTDVKAAVQNAEYLAFWYQPLLKREKIEVGFASGQVGGGQDAYAMLRVDLLNYANIAESEWGTNVWKLVKIPIEDFFDPSKTIFDANGTTMESFDWNRLVGFSIVTSDEGELTYQPNFCRLDEIKVVGKRQGGTPTPTVGPTAEPGEPTPTPAPSADPTREPIEPGKTPEAKGATEQLFFDDNKVGWSVAYTDSQDRANYISEIVDTTVWKNGKASYRLKVDTPYYTNTDLDNLEMLYCDIVNNPTTYSPDKENTYLEFWYQPLNPREKIEVGFACGSGKPYAMLRVNLMDYITITEYGSNAPWQLVRIPMSGFKDESKTTFYRNNSSYSSFDWTRFAGFSIAASDENLNGQLEYCRLDDIQIVRYINAPAQLTVTDNSYDQVTLQWKTPGESVDGYYIYRDGVHVGTTSNLTFTDTGLQGNHMYTYWVQAYKGSAESEAASVDAVTDGYFSEKPGTGVSFEDIRYTVGGEALSDYILKTGTLNFNASIDVEEISSSVYAVAAIYSGNAMKDCQIQEITPDQAGNTVSFAGQFNVENTQEYVDIFVVDSLGQFHPMTGCYRISASAYQILDGVKNPASVNGVKASYSPRTKRISLDLGASAGTAVVAVVAADADLENITAGDFVWIGSVKAGNGVQEIAFPAGRAFAEGEYLAIAANPKDSVQSASFYYASDETIEGIYEVLNDENATDQQILDALTNRALALDLTDFNQLTQSEKLSVAGLFKEFYNGDEAALEDAFSKAQGAVILSSYPENGCGMILKYGGYFEIGEQFINGIEGGYSAKVKGLIDTLMKDREVVYDTDSNLEANAVSKVETVCILALLSDSDLTWSRMKTYLTETFADYNIVDDIEFLKELPSSVYKNMLGKTYKSFEDVQEALKDAMDDAGIDEDGNNTGGSGSGGSGGGSGSGGSGGSGGGSGISRPGGIVLQPPGPNVSDSDEDQQETTVYFKDAADIDWAYDIICDMAEKGVVSYAEEFRPNDQTTRAEFVKMVVQAFGMLDPEAQCSFSDVPADAWEYSYVASAVAAGIVNGVGDSRFDPTQPITRQDMACIVYRILNTSNGDGKQFTDQDQISDYAMDAVMAMSGLGVINGYEDQSFKPGQFATRAETVVMLSRAMEIETA